MIEQEMHLPLASRSDGLNRTAQPADIGQAIAVIIAITKSEWISQGRASPALDEIEARSILYSV